MEKGIFNNTFRNRVTLGVDNRAKPENGISTAGEPAEKASRSGQDFSLEIGKKDRKQRS